MYIKNRAFGPVFYADLFLALSFLLPLENVCSGLLKHLELCCLNDYCLYSAVLYSQFLLSLMC